MGMGSKETELHYLNSILNQLRDIRTGLQGPSLYGEILADNIDWLDCHIDKVRRTKERMRRNTARYSAANPEKRKEQNRRWYSAHAERERQKRRLRRVKFGS